MPADLSGSRRRLARAKESLDELTQRVDAFAEDEPYQIDIAPTAGPAGAIKCTLRVVKNLPDDWDLDVSEIGHQLRAALDNLVYQLVIDNGHDPDNSRTQFPIFDNERDYRVKKGKRPALREQMLENVARRNKMVIDQLQPYQAGPRQARRHPLQLLKLISDRDKHKAPHAALAIMGEPYVVLGSPLVPGQNFRIQFPPIVVTGDTELFELAPDQANGTQIDEIVAEAALVFGTYQVDVDDLERMVAKVSEILDRFDRRLGQ